MVELEEEEEESFFDLELTVSDFDIKKIKSNNDPVTNNDKEHNQSNPSKKSVPNFSDPKLSLSPNDSISRRKILPIEPSSKPQSPISLLKSAPKFQVLMFKKPKSKSMPTPETEKTESKTISMNTQKLKKQESKAFTVKFKAEEQPNNSLLTRAYSSRKSESKLQDHQASDSEDTKTERFSKDLMQKYLNLVKPLYVKVSKRYSDKIRFSEELSVAGSPSSSPATMTLPKKEKQGKIPAGIRVVCKHLGKSKSSSAIGAVPVVNRRDDSLLQQQDGIQSAILHCKRSFNASRDSSSLSRSISDSLHEKSSNSYSRDSSQLWRSSSEPSKEKSIGICIEE